MKTGKTHSFLTLFVFFILTVAPCAMQAEDALLEPPLTWSVNSIQIVWSVTEGATSEQTAKYLYSADKTKSEDNSRDRSNVTSEKFAQNVSAGGRVSTSGSMNSNPFELFGLTGMRADASGFLEGGITYSADSQNSQTNQWTDSERTNVQAVFSASETTSVQKSVSNCRLVFTIDFVNHTASRLYFDPESSNTVPIYCGSTHLGDAALTAPNMSIAATGAPIPCQFSMLLDDTGKEKLLEYRPKIRIERGQLLIRTMDGAREPVEDAVQESLVKGGFFTISLFQGDRKMEWKFRYLRKKPVSVSEALEAINEKICSDLNDDTRQLFDLTAAGLQSVCGIPVSETSDSEWTVVISDVTTPDDLSSLLSSTPRRGADIQFRLIQTKNLSLMKSAEQGDASAQFDLGMRYLDGDGVEKDEVQAAEWFRKAAEQGNAEAQCRLGVCYRRGLGVEQDDKQAVEWFRKAAELGCAAGQLGLGACYLDGLGVEQDDKLATEWFRKAADQGDAEAQCRLGVCYRDGLGVEQDYEQAAEWFRKSAEQENPEALSYLGKCYLGGEGVAKDGVLSAKWFRKAAENGSCELGLSYRDGLGVEQDYKQAAEWFRKAAKQGNAYGQFELGKCYRNGLGVDQDYKQAAKWFRESAEQGDEKGQFWIGACYRDGLGVEQDDKQAAEWFRKSAEQGNERAKEALRELGE